MPPHPPTPDQVSGSVARLTLAPALDDAALRKAVAGSSHSGASVLEIENVVRAMSRGTRMAHVRRKYESSVT